MTTLQLLSEHSATAHIPSDGTVSVYTSLLNSPSTGELTVAGDFLQRQLKSAEHLPSDLPANANEFSTWVTSNAQRVADQYRQYLADRHAGGGRQFFKNKAHALHFLQHVAPSKLVDGAWLYGTVKHADDWRYHGLIRTYLEELGDGEAALNHVVLYRNLLTEHDCAPLGQLDEVHYLQGAIQLALGHLSDEFLPEVLGYNLGYEQLPLHLLITSFELSELGIDPYYFTLHVTIDNASSGHAHKAVQAILDLMPAGDDQADFLKRLRAGYLLNDLGTNSVAVIRSFDLEHEVVEMLEAKGTFGQHMHSDYCRLEGRTVNEWLAVPGQCAQFLQALENRGWIKRHQDPENSRFWQLIDGAGAVMFGVFNGYEKQLLNDWISGDWLPDTKGSRSNPFRSRSRNRSAQAQPLPVTPSAGEFSAERLISLLAPESHPTPAGLEATKKYARQLSQGCSA